MNTLVRVIFLGFLLNYQCVSSTNPIPDADQARLITNACDDMKTCRMYCENGFKKDDNNCPICECDLGICYEVQCPADKVCMSFELDYTGHKIARCIDPTLPPKCWGVPDVGFGRQSLTMHYYDSEKDECETFRYLGRGGNQNKYPDFETCIGTCVKGLCVNPKEMNCKMLCPLGFKEDKKGCSICECNEPEPEPEQGDQCPDVMCMRYCPYGKRRDDRGCETCNCRQKPKQTFQAKADCPVQECRMHCELGYEEDEHGCPLCECKEPACPEIMCEMFCEYGFERGVDGCPVCTCAEDPCIFEECPAERPTCKAIRHQNGRWEAKCRRKDRHWCVPLACMMECENGFTNDKYGCDICECRLTIPEECPMMRCAIYCEFGYKYLSNGCRGCECLPDPCEYKKNDIECGPFQVCEPYKDPAMHYMAAVPTMPKCILNSEVQRLEVELNYVYDNPDYDFAANEMEFEEELKSSISRMMFIDDEYIRGISVRSVGPQECSVTFSLISYGNLDLVEVMRKLHEKFGIELDSAFNSGSVRFTPVEESVEAHYYSDPDIYDVPPSESPPESSATMFIIIGCVIGGVVLLVAVSAIIVLVVRTRQRQKKHEEARKNIAYHKVKKRPISTESATRPKSGSPDV